MPPGASLGTSASVVVALLGALDELVGGGRRLPDDLARLAHQVETERAGREAGVQDQWAAAMGGVGLLAVGPYPDVRHEPIDLAGPTSPTSWATASSRWCSGRTTRRWSTPR